MTIRRITVEAYREELASKGIKKSIFTIRRWCREGKIEAEKDPGGWNWIVILKA